MCVQAKHQLRVQLTSSRVPTASAFPDISNVMAMRSVTTILMKLIAVGSLLYYVIPTRFHLNNPTAYTKLCVHTCTGVPQPTQCDAKTQFDCAGDHSNCISIELVCDGKNDCGRGEDELSSLCRKREYLYTLNPNLINVVLERHCNATCCTCIYS